MKPTIGRIVIVKGGAAASNGTDCAPAIITRVWNDSDTRNGPAMINTTAFCDCANNQHISSVSLYDDEELADASGSFPVAFWPARG